MSRLVEHARRELDLLGEEPGFAASLVAAVAAYASFGHSGGSHACALDMLTRLLQGENLTPLTADPDEWADRSKESGRPFWQNERNSKAFSTDRGLTYTMLNDPEGKDAHRSVPPPWWVASLQSRTKLDEAGATAAVVEYLKDGPLNASDRATLDKLTPWERRRYMGGRWGALAGPVVEMLYQPPMEPAVLV